jgi:hypothetical protein
VRKDSSFSTLLDPEKALEANRSFLDARTEMEMTTRKLAADFHAQRQNRELIRAQTEARIAQVLANLEREKRQVGYQER